MYRKEVIVLLIGFGTLFGACSGNSAQVREQDEVTPTEELVEVTPAIETETTAATEVTNNDNDNSANENSNSADGYEYEYKTDEFPQTFDYTEQPPMIDPAKGYFVEEIADRIYWLSGSGYQTMFLTTGEGVIAIDAPQPIGQSYLAAIQEVTDEPVTHVVYSHAHDDHVGAAGIFPPDADYIAHQDAAALLSGVPAATTTFEDNYTLEVGDQVLELSYIGTFHSDGDIVINAPKQMVAMVVDLFHPGSAPFAGFGITIDLGAHLKAHTVLIEEYNFDVMIPGHTQILATKAHLETNRNFVISMQEIVEQAVESGSTENVIQTCIDLTTEQWNEIIENVEERVGANCQKMVEYVLSQT